MDSLWTSANFWFGAVLLCAFQIGKFNELNQLDEDLKVRSTIVPNLRARDFLGQRSYIGILVVFLVATFGVYLGCCSLSPSVMEGWIRVVDKTTDDTKIHDIINS